MKKTTVFLSVLFLTICTVFSEKSYSQTVSVTQFTGVRTTPTSNIAKLTLTAYAPYSTGWYLFNVEKSSSSTGPFSSIGSVSITSNSSTTYIYYDNNFIATSYYRIKFLNRNGKVLYSSTIGVAH
jgi:hypothetical protein